MKWALKFFIRNPKGITLTRDGMEFLSYARQVVEQTQLLEERYKNPVAHRELLAFVSTLCLCGQCLCIATQEKRYGKIRALPS